MKSEKEELEMQIFEQSGHNEQLQQEVSEITMFTDCDDCKRKQLKVTLL